jgi:hypothetical protein
MYMDILEEVRLNLDRLASAAIVFWKVLAAEDPCYVRRDTETWHLHVV